MIIAVYQAQSHDSRQRVLLVVPADTEPLVADHHKDHDWKLLGTTTLADRLLAPALPIVQAEIASHGYAFLQVTGPRN